MAFVHATPIDSGRPLETVWVVADESGIQQPRASAALSRERRTGMGVSYPTSIVIGEMRMDRARVVESPPFAARVLYDVPGGTALCEVINPQRFRWPLVGRMMEMGIHHA